MDCSCWPALCVCVGSHEFESPGTQDKLKALGCCQPWSLPVCVHSAALSWRGSNHWLPWGHSARDRWGWQQAFPVPPPHPAGGLYTPVGHSLWWPTHLLPGLSELLSHKGPFPWGSVMGDMNKTVPFALAMGILTFPSMECGRQGCGQQGKRSHSKNTMIVA